MSILQDFFHGELLPWEHFGCSNDPTYKIYSNKIADLENSLAENMTEKEREVLAELNQLKLSQNNMELERMFLYAFRMGALFVLDLYSDQ